MPSSMTSAALDDLSPRKLKVDLLALRRKLGTFQFVQGAEYIIKLMQAAGGAALGSFLADRFDGTFRNHEAFVKRRGLSATSATGPRGWSSQFLKVPAFPANVLHAKASSP